jgi:hypothetical protein
MEASGDISSDYDLIVSFFDLMQSLLERVSLLEGRIPPEKTFKAILMQVFASLLGLCGIATREVKGGRMSEFYHDSKLMSRITYS